MFPLISKNIVSFRELVIEDALKQVDASLFKEHTLERAKDVCGFAFSYTVRDKEYDGFLAYPMHTQANQATQVNQEAQITQSFPTIIFHRGGFGDFGKIEDWHVLFGKIAFLVSLGYAVIGSQNMGSGDEGASDEMGGEDFYSVLVLKDIVLENNTFFDSSKIGMYGGSRGGMTIFRLLSDEQWLSGWSVKSAVVISGIADYTDTTFRPKMEELFHKVLGDSQEEREKRSVLKWPEKLSRQIPLLLMYGSSDWRVDPRTGIRLTDALLQHKIPHRFVLFEGSDHALSESRQEVGDMTKRWFERFIQNDEALPNLEPHGV